jgi:hypothetical protein
MDGREFRTFARGVDFCNDLKARIRSSILADAQLQPLSSRLSATQIETIVSFCIPVQKRRPTAREEIDRREREMEQLLRDQQRPVLQLAALNDRVIVTGAAGTGKTLIAMEVARRAADEGRRVGLVCFNQLVGDWMRRQIESSLPSRPNLIVGRTIRILADMTGVSIPRDPSPYYWAQDLPAQLEERLTDPEFRAAATFDYLVVDEAQDLLARPGLWECLTRFLEGGIAAGSFCLFGDFDNQVLGDHDVMDWSLGVLHDYARPTRYRLSENCRNYRIIGDTALRLSGFSKPVYSGYMRVGGGIQNYDIFFYAEESEQRDKLSQWLREFKAQSYKPAEITVLSFRSSEDCAAARLAPAGFSLRPAWQHSTDSTCYASVQAFKGLENKVVILTDVALDGTDFQRHLFYTGMTRASECVRVLCDRISQKTLTGWLTGKVDHE